MTFILNTVAEIVRQHASARGRSSYERRGSSLRACSRGRKQSREIASPTACGPRSALRLNAHGQPTVWLFGGALAICLLMILGLLYVVIRNGMATFWPEPAGASQDASRQSLHGRDCDPRGRPTTSRKPRCFRIFRPKSWQKFRTKAESSAVGSSIRPTTT